MNDLHPALRVLRLGYRASRTPFGQDFLALLGLIALGYLCISLLSLTCVGLHGEAACFNHSP